MYIVIRSWAGRNHFRWQENFIEQVNLDLMSDHYIEMDIIVPIF
jgi:hypothetical protein